MDPNPYESPLTVGEASAASLPAPPVFVVSGMMLGAKIGAIAGPLCMVLQPNLWGQWPTVQTVFIAAFAGASFGSLGGLLLGIAIGLVLAPQFRGLSHATQQRVWSVFGIVAGASVAITWHWQLPEFTMTLPWKVALPLGCGYCCFRLARLVPHHNESNQPPSQNVETSHTDADVRQP